MKYISGKIIRLVAGLSLVAYMVGSCSKPSREERDLEYILQSAKRHFMQRNIDSAIYYADSLRRRSDTVRSPHAYIASLVYLGEGHMIKGNDDSMVAYFNRASELAVRYRDDWAMGVMNNILGIQSLYNRLDSKRCINCLLDGLRFAERSGDETLISMLKCNLALAYYVRRDPSGLEYARDVYDTGVGKKDMYMIYCGSLTSAYMYYCVGEYETAGEYIVTALPLAHTYKDEHGVYTLYGDILLKLGREAEAKACYDKALATNNPEDRFSGIDIYLSYGNYLKDGRRYRQALTMLESGIEIADRNANTMNRYLLYEAAAQICSLMSDRGGYERYMMLYKGDRDSIFNINSERVISQLKVSYERDKYEGMVSKTVADERKARSRLRAIILASLFVFIVSTVVLFVRFRRKEQNLLAMLAMQRDRFSPDNGGVRNPDASERTVPRPEAGTDRKMEEIYRRLEALMREEHIYRDAGITREKVAAMLSTNRTYLTSVIGKYAGQSFLAYVNTFRIEEAVGILSDPGKDIPIKALVHDLGFGSVSTFYKLFTAATGHSPSHYRSLFSGSDNLPFSER
ncbi:helix-turn-helix domain-containing protein [Alistipes sp.]|uniref:helix-turn-helix domain-containing protein n=1 Tax=Alistipes sp. TaxID=1872444 RepID=UPI003AF096F8